MKKEDDADVVIDARVGGGKEALLVTWFLAWLLIGLFVIRERTQVPVGDPDAAVPFGVLGLLALFRSEGGSGRALAVEGL